MNDEPGIDLSNPEPETHEDQQRHQILGILRERPWLNMSVQQTAGPAQQILSLGSVHPVLIPTGPGAITFTITVPA